MARFKYTLTESKLRRFAREKRGQGQGSTYKPWLTVQDVPSRGRVHRVSCKKTGGRSMHLLSDHEFAAFLELWWDSEVTDIREQYPLDLRRTLGIASGMGIKHPKDSHSGMLLVQTTDLLATLGHGDGMRLIAWAVKNQADLTLPRSLDKLEIERRYWSARGIQWQLVVNDGLNSNRALNLKWLLDYENALPFKGIPPVSSINRVLQAVASRRRELVGPLCNQLDARHDVALGTHVDSFRFLLLARGLSGDADASEFFRQPFFAFMVK